MRHWMRLLLAVLMVFGSIGLASAVKADPADSPETFTYTEDLGNKFPIALPVDATDPGKTFTATATVNNASTYQIKLWLESGYIPKIDSGLVSFADSKQIPTEKLLDPGESFTLSVDVAVSAEASAAVSTTINIPYSVALTFDQVWRDKDYTDWEPQSLQTLEASDPVDDGRDWALAAFGTGTAFVKPTILHNDYAYPVAISFKGYSDSGPAAPYVTGKVTGWTDQTLAPGASTDQFKLYFGMPIYIGNESAGLSGSFIFSWNVQQIPPPDPKPVVGDTGHDQTITLDIPGAGTAKGADLTITDVTGGTGGSWSIVGNRIVFNPDPDFTGQARASFTVADEFGQTGTGTIVVDVAAAAPPSGSPTPASSTPASPTPASPTPASPTPASPTPGSSTQGSAPAASATPSSAAPSRSPAHAPVSSPSAASSSPAPTSSRDHSSSSRDAGPAIAKTGASAALLGLVAAALVVAGLGVLRSSRRNH